MHAQAHRFVRICVGRRGGWDASGHATIRGGGVRAYVRGFSLPSPKRRDARRPGFVLRSADKKQAPRGERPSGRAGDGM